MPENGSVRSKHAAKGPSSTASRGRGRGLREPDRRRGPEPLEPQLYVHEHDLRAAEISAVHNDADRITKPGVLWTSTYDPEYGSAWLQWCVAYRYTDPF